MEIHNSPKQAFSLQTFLTIGAIFVAFCGWLGYYYTRPVANVEIVNDMSDSNAINKKAMTQVCEQIKDNLIDRDVVVNGGFANNSMITGNATYNENTSKLDCNKISVKPKGVGKQDGTSIIGVLKTASLVERRLRAEGNKHPVVLFLTIDAAEPGRGQKVFDPKVVKQLLQQITKNGYVVIIGAEVGLQNILSQELVNLPNIDWAFEKVRKYPGQ
jgi:hypothetical protein